MSHSTTAAGGPVIEMAGPLRVRPSHNGTTSLLNPAAEPDDFGPMTLSIKNRAEARRRIRDGGYPVAGLVEHSDGTCHLVMGHVERQMSFAAAQAAVEAEFGSVTWQEMADGAWVARLAR